MQRDLRGSETFESVKLAIDRFVKASSRRSPDKTRSEFERYNIVGKMALFEAAWTFETHHSKVCSQKQEMSNRQMHMAGLEPAAHGLGTG